MLTPLSEPLQKLRRAQRALVRRKRRSRVRVSFQHSTSTRGPKADAVKTPTGQGNNSRDLYIPTNGSRPAIPRREASSFQDQGCCPASSSKPRAPQQAIFEKGTGNSSRHLPENRPYFGTLAKSPIRVTPLPEAQRVSLTATSGYIRPGGAEEGRPDIPLRDTSQATPTPNLSAPPTRPRYNVFPKPENPQRAPVMRSQPAITDLVSSEPAQRSLSQQLRLSSLVPPGCLPTTTTKRKQPAKQSFLPRMGSTRAPPPVQESSQGRLRSPSQKVAVDKFARELEEFAEAAGVAGRLLASPSEIDGINDSVQTVQDFLPYRTQFREAGLAVTSEDQKPPLTEKSQPRLQQKSSNDGRLRFDGGRSFGQGSLSTSKTSSEDTVHVGPADEACTGGKLGRFKLTVESSPLPPDQGTMTASETKASYMRPSAVFQERRPPPTEPVPPKPTGLSRERVDRIAEFGRNLHEAHTSAVGHPLGKLDATPGSSTSATAVLYPSTSSSTSQDSCSKFDKCLPRYPSPNISSQAQQALSFPNKTTWNPPARQLPVTIEEDRVPSSEKHKPINKTTIICPEDEVVVRTKSSGTQTTRLPAKPSSSSKPELPETWKEAIGSPFSFEKALDDVVRKLDDMGDSKPTKAERPRSAGRRGTKPSSPSSRLQRAAKMRRQHLAEGTVQDTTATGQASSKAPAIPLRRSRSSTTAQPSEVAQEQALEDGDIKDKDVLAGLKVICAASADQELDSWIHSKTGLRLRRFLSDLKSFEGLAQEGIAVVDGERSRMGRAEKRRARARVEKAARRQSMKK
ncbi:hypothetical protein QBC39DRAFT_63510 [Podospora conica]|nr:hypothetical protein QBC39DRAFT_63510 [Schizothecium conicum]